MIYAWQKAHWDRLLADPAHMHHALLIAGPQGGGKADFAIALAHRLLCESAQGLAPACGTCPSCRWMASDNHPDFRRVVPGAELERFAAASDEDATPADATEGKKSDAILIEQVRALEDFLALGTHRQGARVVFIQPAEAMNAATSNALLKMLEEPTPGTHFLLVTHAPRRLLPTLLSRCQQVAFPRPPEAEALSWLSGEGVKNPAALLAHAGGMPLAAAALGQATEQLSEFVRDVSTLTQAGALTVAARWELWQKDATSPLERRTLAIWLQKWVQDLIAVRMGVAARFYPEHREVLRRKAQTCTLIDLFDCYNALHKIRGVAQHPLNVRLFFEDMLLRYARATRAN